MIQPTLSFCIAYNKDIYDYNLTDIRKILKQNLRENSVYKEYVEFVIFDFSREADIYSWLLKSCNEELESGYLKYYRAKVPGLWHEAIAKNRTTTYASKEIVVNIDSGFMVDFATTTYIMKAFLKNKNIVIPIRSPQEDAHPGHLAVSCEYFTLSGGYDESFEPAGFHTPDLISRLVNLGLIEVSYQQKDVDYSSFKSSLVTCGYTYTEYNRMLHDNFIRSKRNIAQGYLIANEGS